jgi:hypothetical protein
MAAWIRIRIPNADPDPGGLKSAKKEGKPASKRQIIRHKKDEKQCNGYKMGKCYFIFIKSQLLICLYKIYVFNVLPGSAWIRIHFQSWTRIRVRLKGWIRIRRKSMRIRNTGFKVITRLIEIVAFSTV